MHWQHCARPVSLCWCIAYTHEIVFTACMWTMDKRVSALQHSKYTTLNRKSLPHLLSGSEAQINLFACSRDLFHQTSTLMMPLAVPLSLSPFSPQLLALVPHLLLPCSMQLRILAYMHSPRRDIGRMHLNTLQKQLGDEPSIRYQCQLQQFIHV